MKIRPSKKMLAKILRRFLLVSMIIGLTVCIWSTSYYDCVNLYFTEVCGSIPQDRLVYLLVGLDVFLALYLLLPLFSFSATKFVIKSKNKAPK